MTRKLLSDTDVKSEFKKGRKSINVEKTTIVTSAAIDRAKSLGIEIILEAGSPTVNPKTASDTSTKIPSRGIVTIGSDHGGYQMKELLKPFIQSLGYVIKDVGTSSEEACDYPDFAFAVAKLVSTGEVDRGIMIDAVGIASAMVANKIPGIRAAACQSEFGAQSSREHNDANVLTLGGRIIGIELAKSIVKTWLLAEFSGGRHQKRVQKISDIDEKFRRS
jgi:ribose 5-phosphate isomerase B